VVLKAVNGVTIGTVTTGIYYPKFTSHPKGEHVHGVSEPVDPEGSICKKPVTTFRSETIGKTLAVDGYSI